MFARFFTQSAVAAYTALSLLTAVSCTPAPHFDLFQRTPAQGVDVKSLAPKLSPNTKIYLPNTSEFLNFTVRWSNLEPPTPSVVIAPGTEQDVAKIVSPI